MASIFNVYIFTSSIEEYAKAVVKMLDPNEKYISGILSRK